MSFFNIRFIFILVITKYLFLENPCELGCFIEKTNEGYAMGPMKDGTDCATSAVKGKCVNGVCQVNFVKFFG